MQSAEFCVGQLAAGSCPASIQSENGLGSFECYIDNEDGRVATATVTVFQPPNVDVFVRKGGSE